jgi:hypothetical protein
VAASVDDGPHFPRYAGQGQYMRIVKRGRSNANYSMEFNAWRGNRRMMLLLSGKEKMWFRLHCYLCGAWMEVSTNCTHRTINYSASKPKMEIPLNNTDSGSCQLWKGGETKKTLAREKYVKRNRGAIFDDIILPIKLSGEGSGGDEGGGKTDGKGGSD